MTTPHRICDVVYEDDDIIVIRRREGDSENLRHFSGVVLVDQDEFARLLDQASLGLALQEKARDLSDEYLNRGSRPTPAGIDIDNNADMDD